MGSTISFVAVSAFQAFVGTKGRGGIDGWLDASNGGKSPA
jgi:hypothetical protein